MKQKIRVTLRDSNWFDMEMPDDFNFLAFAQAIRSAGCLLGDKMYVPHEMIASIFIHQEGTPPIVQSRETLQ